MIPRKIRELQLLKKASTEDGREELIQMYRKILGERDPMPLAIYPAIIQELLDSEYPPKKPR